MPLGSGLATSAGRHMCPPSSASTSGFTFGSKNRYTLVQNQRPASQHGQKDDILQSSCPGSSSDTAKHFHVVTGFFARCQKL